MHFTSVIDDIVNDKWRHYPPKRTMKEQLKQRGLAMWRFKAGDLKLEDSSPHPSSFWMEAVQISNTIECVREKVINFVEYHLLLL